MRRPIEVAVQALEIRVAQRLTHVREHIHYVIIVLGVVADGGEDEAAILVEKQIPRGVYAAAPELGHPRIQGRPLERVGLDIALDVAQCNRGNGPRVRQRPARPTNPRGYASFCSVPC